MAFFSKSRNLDPQSLKSVFETQGNVLIEKGYPAFLELTEDAFRQQLTILWNAIQGKADTLQIPESSPIPLLIVVQGVDPHNMLKAINGYTEIDLSNTKTVTTPPKSSLYAIFDVEDGKKYTAKSCEDSIAKLEKQGRSPLSLTESGALVTQYPDILHDHYAVAGATRFMKEGEEMPLIWLLDTEDRPELHYTWFNIAHGNYGTASYSRLISF